MNIVFAGFRHGHILWLYDMAEKSDRVNIKGCFEENEKARESAKNTLGANFCYSSYEEVLHDDSVNAIAIGDYYGKRGKMIIDALKSGKNVICDKPLCTSLEELDEIESLVKKTGLKVSCMLDMRYKIQVRKVIELINNGEIGKIHNISFTGQHCLDYGNRPEWYFEDGKHGGTINDIAIHGIDLIRFVTGKNLTKVNCARVWNAFATQEKHFKDCGQFMVQMEDVSVMADVSYAAPKYNSTLPTYWDFYIWGEKGMMNFRGCENIIHVYKDAEEIISCEPEPDNLLDDFINEVEGKTRALDTLWTLESQRQVLLIQKSADEYSDK